MSSSFYLVGDAGDMDQARPLLSGLARSFERVDLSDLDLVLARPGPPPLVASLAISGCFDCFDVAHILTFRSFVGRYRVLPVGLPKPEILMKEARRQFPELDVELLNQPELTLQN